jgi:hypothetical protein
MTDSAKLERGYRRLLACYPKAFRRECEEEILAVLLATAGADQRRVGLAAAADLIMGALRMHLGTSRPPRPVRIAARLMCLGAVLTLAAAATVVLTLGSVRSAAVQDVDFTGGRWHIFVLTMIVPALASAPIGAGVWLWLAWAIGRGYRWARPAFLALFGALSLVLFFGASEGGGDDALAVTWPDVLAVTALWAVGLAAVLLIFSTAASPHYQREPARR